MDSFKNCFCFVNFEGIDNSGKSSLIVNIANEFSKVIPVYVTKELSTDIGEIILKRLTCHSIDLYEKVLLFAADRQQRYVKEIVDRKNENCLYLADRWFFSAIAYRCAEDPSIKEYVLQVNKIFIKPTITIYIDITAQESVKRGLLINKNHYTESFLNKVREEYLVLCKEYSFIRIDGMRDYCILKEEVFSIIKKKLREFYNNNFEIIKFPELYQNSKL